jgi:hypothetical protein
MLVTVVEARVDEPATVKLVMYEVDAREVVALVVEASSVVN